MSLPGLQAALEAATAREHKTWCMASPTVGVPIGKCDMDCQLVDPRAAESLAALAPVMAAELVQAEEALRQIRDEAWIDAYMDGGGACCVSDDTSLYDFADAALARLAAVDRQASE